MRSFQLNTCAETKLAGTRARHLAAVLIGNLKVALPDASRDAVQFDHAHEEGESVHPDSVGGSRKLSEQAQGAGRVRLCVWGGSSPHRRCSGAMCFDDPLPLIAELFCVGRVT